MTRRTPTRALLGTSLSMAGGVALAAVPPSLLAIGGQTLPIQAAGLLTVGITVGTFLGQLSAAILVEAPLAVPGSGRRVATPVWVSAIGVVGALLMVLGSGGPWLVAIAAAAVLTALEVGRAVGVAEGYQRREIAAALVLGCTMLGGLAVALMGLDCAFALLGAGAFVTVLIRAVGLSGRAGSAPLRTRLWIAGDVGVTGAVFPILNVLILSILGPVAAYLFGAASTVSGLLAIPLNFMRVRLLRAPERSVVLLTAVVIAVAGAAVAIAQLLGLFGLLFGTEWASADIAAPLLVACAWRAASLLTTLPFAAIRRMGAVILLWALRSACVVATLALLAGLLPLASLTWVFVGLLAGELLQAIVYALAARRLVSLDRAAESRPARVLVDLLFMTGRRGGMETYVREMYSRIEPRDDVEFIALASRELAATDTSWFPGRVIDSRVRTSRAANWLLAELTLVSGTVRRMGVDLVHAPANIAPRTGPAPLLVTIHDVISLERPDLVPSPRGAIVLRALLRQASRRATRILTVSAASASAIGRTLAVPSERITVIPLAASAGATAVTADRATDVVLVPGNRMPHKNGERLLEAVATMPAGARPRVVFTGDGSADDPLRPVVERLGLEGNVDFAGWVSAEELDRLYAVAALVVLPTLYEGFGLPVLEAMRRGTPVACSDIPVLREVAGDAAVYFDPENASQIAVTLAAVLDDHDQRVALSARGRIRAELFSWDAAAAATRQAIIETSARPTQSRADGPATR